MRKCVKSYGKACMRVCHGQPNLPIHLSYPLCKMFAQTASLRATHAAFLVLCFSAASRNLLFSSFCFLVLVLSRPFAISSRCLLVRGFSVQVLSTSKTTANGYRRSATSETTANGYRRSLPAKQPLMDTKEAYQQNNR